MHNMSFPENILCETSTATDGTMSFKGGDIENVTENRLRFLKKFGIESEAYIPILCNHGETITVVDTTHASLKTVEPKKGVLAEVVATQEKSIALFLLTADCQPMSFFDPVTQTIALAHISRVTLTKKLPQKTVLFLRNTFGVDPANLLILIGPCIKKESYAFPLPLSSVDPVLRTHIKEKGGYAQIDLLGASIEQLTASGVMKKNISVSPIDTGSSADYFSYFRMKKEGVSDTARMATVLMMR